MKKDTTPLAKNNLRPNKVWPSWDDTADMIAEGHNIEPNKRKYNRQEQNNHFINNESN